MRLASCIVTVWKVLVKNGLDLNRHHSQFLGDALSLEVLWQY